MPPPHRVATSGQNEHFWQVESCAVIPQVSMTRGDPVGSGKEGRLHVHALGPGSVTQGYVQDSGCPGRSLDRIGDRLGGGRSGRMDGDRRATCLLVSPGSARGEVDRG